jgi:molybdopterin biosynthesis enzyme
MRLAGQANPFPERRKAVLANEINVAGSRQTFLWCKLEWQENSYKVSASLHQGSGQNRSLADTNAILPVPIGIKKLTEGDTVEVFML